MLPFIYFIVFEPVGLAEKILHHKEFGEIRLIKSSRAKNISISIRPFQGIKVTVPIYVSFSRAEKFIAQKESWLKKNMGKIRSAESNHTLFDDHTEFYTVEHTLQIERTDQDKPVVKIMEKKIRVFCPASADIRSKEIQEIIRWGIEAAWRKEAKKHLPARLNELARIHGFSYNKVSIKNNRTRWGSCSSRNNINLSLHLMRLPSYLADYVILHELAHTIHRNHSKQFWKHLDKLTGDAKMLDKELSQYRLDIY
jgi:predicted metal-dependent hydrolase